MSTLDEDLLNKITYHPECQATFRKYKERLKKEHFSSVLVVILTPVIVPK